MKLYEIKEEIESTFEFNEGGLVVNTLTGEVMTTEEFEEKVGQFNDGIENLCCWIKNLRSDAKAIKEEEDNLKSRRERCEKKAESLAKYVEYLLKGEKFSTSKVNVTYRENTHCEVKDNVMLPDEFVTIKTTPNKKELTKYLKAGNKIDGVSLVVEKKMSIK